MKTEGGIPKVMNYSYKTHITAGIGRGSCYGAGRHSEGRQQGHEDMKKRARI